MFAPRSHAVPDPGFTLVELMVVLSVLGILAAIAVPGMNQLLGSQRVRMLSYDLVADLTLARSEAIKRGANVSLVANESDWLKGWRMQVAGSNEVIAEHPPVASNVTFTAVPAANPTFDRNGRSTATATVRFGVAFGTSTQRCITLDPAGVPRSTERSCPT